MTRKEVINYLDDTLTSDTELATVLDMAKKDMEAMAEIENLIKKHGLTEYMALCNRIKEIVPNYKEDGITVSIKIPKELVFDYKTDKFKDFFERVACDIKGGILCGNYEQETAEMLKKAFEESVKM